MQLEKLPPLLKHLRKDHPITLVFIEATEDALLRRYSETRRPHPLGKDLVRSRELAPRTHADGAHSQARRRGDRHHAVQRPRTAPLHHRSASRTPTSARCSFPSSASAIATASHPTPISFSTCAFCPIRTSCRACAATLERIPKSARYIRSFPQTGEFLRRIEGLLTYLIPHYIREGKSYLTIAFGCTGGKHRSVMLAEAGQEIPEETRLLHQGVHRDIEK